MDIAPTKNEIITDTEIKITSDTENKITSDTGNKITSDTKNIRTYLNRNLRAVYQATMLDELKNNISVHYDKSTNYIYVKYTGHENTICANKDYYILIKIQRDHPFIAPECILLAYTGFDGIVKVNIALNYSKIIACFPLTSLINTIIFSLSDGENSSFLTDLMYNYELYAINVTTNISGAINIDTLISIFNEITFIKTLSKQFISEYIDKKIMLFINQ
jgi:hypothetical protein